MASSTVSPTIFISELYAIICAFLPTSIIFGIRFKQFIPSTDVYAANEAPWLPFEAQMILWKSQLFAWEINSAAARSLKELVGFWVSSLKKRLFIPNFSPNCFDLLHGVPPSPNETKNSLSIWGRAKL